MNTILNQGIVNINEQSEILLDRESLDEDALKRIIRGVGLKATSQRLHILKSLNRGRAHRTVQEIFEAVQKIDLDIGFATVYRFLRDLAESGYVTEIRMGRQAARYELTPKLHHDHLSCVKCGQIVEFHHAEIERLQELVARNNGFQLTSHVLELYGLCSACKV
jgi:Fur family ferric uptake transcriptional regulator